MWSIILFKKHISAKKIGEDSAVYEQEYSDASTCTTDTTITNSTPCSPHLAKLTSP